MEDKECLKCREIKEAKKDFFVSYSSLHADRRYPICKECLFNMIDMDDIDTVKDTLRKMDRPFLVSIWNRSVKEAKEHTPERVFGLYLKNQVLGRTKHLTWADSDFEDEETVVGSTPNKLLKAFERVTEGLTDEEIEERKVRLETRWGTGHKPEVVELLEKKYMELSASYPLDTSIHEEALTTYCVYKVRAELAAMRDDPDGAKKWGELAQKQGNIAKINLDKADLTQGLDGFSALARRVEQEVDVIPVLPRYIEKPSDQADLAIYSFVNYERRLNGLPDVEYSDIYDFYQDNLREFLNDRTKDPRVKKHIKEIEIEGKNGKKKSPLL